MDFLACVRDAADCGSGMACFEYAQVLFAGRGIDQSAEEGWKYLRKGMALNSSISYYAAYKESTTGNQPTDGLPIEPFFWLRKASELGHSGAIIEYAEYALRCGPENVQDVLDILQPALRQGVAKAYHLREMILALNGAICGNTAVNVSALYQRFLLNDPHAAFALGLQHQFGIYGNYDRAVAAHYMENAKQIVGSSTFLAALALSSEGTLDRDATYALVYRDVEASDCSAAVHLYKLLDERGLAETASDKLRSLVAKAALAGCDSAIQLIGFEPESAVWSEHLGISIDEWQAHTAKSGGGIIAEQIYNKMESGDEASRAFDLLKLTLEGGSSNAYTAFGLHLLTCSDSRKAIPWFYLAHSEGRLRATHELGKFLCNNGRNQGERMAGFEMLKQFADVGQSWACHELSIVFESGLVGPVNQYAANNYLQMAALGDCSIAKSRLCGKIITGDGFEINHGLAEYWNIKTFETGDFCLRAQDNVRRVYHAKEAPVVSLADFKALHRCS